MSEKRAEGFVNAPSPSTCLHCAIIRTIALSTGAEIPDHPGAVDPDRALRALCEVIADFAVAAPTEAHEHAFIARMGAHLTVALATSRMEKAARASSEAPAPGAMH